LYYAQRVLSMLADKEETPFHCALTGFMLYLIQVGKQFGVRYEGR